MEKPRLLSERLKELGERFSTDGFLHGNAISNEDNIWVFAYDAQSEMQVQCFIEMLMKQPIGGKIFFCNLYERFLKICEREDIIDGILDEEQTSGDKLLLETLNQSIPTTTLADDIGKAFHKSKAEYLLIYGVGDAFPFARVHSLLNALPVGISQQKSIVVFYPGYYNGHELRLFNRLTRNGYYRAFSIL